MKAEVAGSFSTERSTSLGGVAESSSSGALKAPEIPEQLDGRLADLELRLREQEEAAQLRETELLAMERDLVLKEAYAKSLEVDRHLLTVELGQVRDRAAELFEDLEGAEARLVELGTLVADIRAQASYRLGLRLVAVLDRAGPLAELARGAARRRRGR